MLLPAGTPFDLENRGDQPRQVLQVASPRPWSADFQGPEPENAVLRERDPSSDS